MSLNLQQWLSEKLVSEITGRAAQTLRNDRCRRRGIPYSKVGRSVRYKMQDVVNYMESRRVEFEK